MITLINATYYDFENYEEDMYITFDTSIIDVGKMKDYKITGSEVDVKNKLIMPGLVNGHSHIYSTFARGMSVPFNPVDFQELLEQLWWKLDRNLDNEMTYYSGVVSGVEYLKNGVTTIIDHHASGEIKGSLGSLKRGLDVTGLRGVYCFESSDRFDIDECIEENNQFIKNNKTSFATGLFGMHAQFTLSDASLEKMKNLVNTPIHIHVAESILDQELCLKEHGKRVVKRLDDFNLITKNSILTHCLYLDDEELSIIKEKDAVIALNVNSNMNNGVGLPNYRLIKQHNIRVIIGNDGLSQNMTSEYLGLYFSMHHKEMDPLGFGFDDLLSVINETYRYASDLLQVKLGKIKTGYAADLVVLDYNNPTPINKENVLGHLLFGLFHDFKPNDVYVNGNKLLDNRTIEEHIIYKYNNAPVFAKKLWDKIEKEGKL